MEPARSNFRYGEGNKVDRNITGAATGNEIHSVDNEKAYKTEGDSAEIESDLTQAPSTTETENRKNIVVGSVWMVVLTCALFFLPAVNGLIAGAVGGYMVGSMKRALMVAVIPALIAAMGLFTLLATLDFPVVGFFVGAAMGVHIVLSEIGLFLGAAIGGTVAQTRVDQYNRG